MTKQMTMCYGDGAVDDDNHNDISFNTVWSNKNNNELKALSASA